MTSSLKARQRRRLDVPSLLLLASGLGSGILASWLVQVSARLKTVGGQRQSAPCPRRDAAAARDRALIATPAASRPSA